MLGSLFKIRLIDIDQAITIFGQGFTHGCNHPLVETIKEYRENPKIKFTQTKLYKFHKNFTPKNTNDALQINSEYIFPLFYYPWGSFRRLNIKHEKNRFESRWCGPTSDKLIQRQFNQIISLYSDIKDNGYKLIAKRSLIGGTFLIKNNGSKKFVVLQGNHRLSVLSELGYKKIFVFTMKGYQERIEEYSLKNLQSLYGISCPLNVSYKFFNAFFKNKNKIEY